MQKIIAKFVHSKKNISENKNAKILFTFFAVILPILYYIVLMIAMFGKEGNHVELATRRIYLSDAFNPFLVAPYYALLAFVAVVIFLKNVILKILMGVVYAAALAIQSISTIGFQYTYELWYIAAPHIIILITGIIIAAKVSKYRGELNNRG